MSHCALMTLQRETEHNLYQSQTLLVVQYLCRLRFGEKLLFITELEKGHLGFRYLTEKEIAAVPLKASFTEEGPDIEQN